jgi:nucleotide-binding universal stress UspA family protein
MAELKVHSVATRAGPERSAGRRAANRSSDRRGCVRGYAQAHARAERDVGDTLEALSDQVLAQARQHALRAGVSDVRLHAGWGDPAEVIIETARRHQVEAIVKGRRGRSRLAGLLLGSVSQKVASLAPCVVILVP